MNFIMLIGNLKVKWDAVENWSFRVKRLLDVNFDNKIQKKYNSTLNAVLCIVITDIMAMYIYVIYEL